MMPQTVPKRPMKGAVLEVVASMESEERRRRISSAMPKCRARRTLSLRRRAASPVALMRLNSRTARRVMPKSGERSSPASAPRAWVREGAASMPSMPAAARRLAANRASHLPPMKAQLTSDMKSKSASTALETRVAWLTALIRKSMKKLLAKGLGTRAAKRGRRTRSFTASGKILPSKCDFFLSFLERSGAAPRFYPTNPAELARFLTISA